MGEGAGDGGDWLAGTCTCEREGLVSLALEGGGGGSGHGGGEVRGGGEGGGKYFHTHQSNMVRHLGNRGLGLLVTSR